MRGALTRSNPASLAADMASEREETIARLEYANRRIFGFDEFRPPQREVLLSALEGEDVMVVMPTGTRRGEAAGVRRGAGECAAAREGAGTCVRGRAQAGASRCATSWPRA